MEVRHLQNTVIMDSWLHLAVAAQDAVVTVAMRNQLQEVMAAKIEVRYASLITFVSLYSNPFRKYFVFILRSCLLPLFLFFRILSTISCPTSKQIASSPL